MCEKRGCHIQDLASDIELNSIVDDLLAARQVLEASGLQEPWKDALLRHGLYEWPNAILRIEVQYARFKKRLHDEQQTKGKKRRR